jgi:predicted DNA-binding transcriptional regulator AlpA
VGELLHEIAENYRSQAETFARLAEAFTEVKPTTAGAESLRGRLWTLEAEERLSTTQVAEACGKRPSWVYKHIDARRTNAPLPYRREASGSRDRLVFLAGDVRAWLKEREVVVRPGVINIDQARRPLKERPKRRNLSG